MRKREMAATRKRRQHQSGQAIVILAISLAALLGLTAIVIDGGNAFVQQRSTQNAVDSAALAGATVMVKNVGDPGSQSGSDVLAAINSAFGANSSDFGTAHYVHYDHTPMGTVGGGTIPADAGGVLVTGSRTFQTYLASLAGIPNMQAD